MIYLKKGPKQEGVHLYAEHFHPVAFPPLCQAHYLGDFFKLFCDTGETYNKEINNAIMAAVIVNRQEKTLDLTFLSAPI